MKKKILSLLLCALMILPCFTFLASAEETYTNIAKEGTPTCSSIWNNWSSIRSVNDGVIDAQLFEHKGGYEFWRPHSCEQGDGIPIDANPWFRISFDDYYEIDSIVLYSEAQSPITYAFDVLVQGEWIEVGTKAHASGTRYVGEDNYNYTNVRLVTVDPAETYTTRAVRVRYTTFVGWDPGFISEIKIMGKPGQAPDFDVPEGAVLSTNAALGGYASASSSATGKFPFNGNDNSTSTLWTATSNTNQWYQIDFTGDYLLTNAKVDFSTVPAGTYGIDIQLCQNGTWSSVYTGNVTAPSASLVGADFGTPKTASAMKVIFTSATVAPAISEVVATIKDGEQKTVFLDQYMTGAKKLSTAGGNLACYGQVYAQNSFKYGGISKPEYLNDGETGDTSPSWFAVDTAANVYVGVKLKEAHKVDMVTLYFNNAKFLNYDAEGNFVLSFDVQVKKTGETKYTTVASGTSYDTKTKKYITTVKFDEVETDDVRILFTSNGRLTPYLTELEVYSHDTEGEKLFKYPHLDGMSTNRAPAAVTTTFAPVSYPKRAAILEKTSPIVYLASYDGLKDMAFLARI